MPDRAVDTVVNALLHAREAHCCVAAADLADVLTDTSQAYAVQAGVACALHWFDDAAPMYWKSGGPSREATLTHAHLPPAGVWKSPATASHWPFNMRGIEAEVALRLGTTVDAQMAASIDETSADALIDAMTASIEIGDSRWYEGLAAPARPRRAGGGSMGGKSSRIRARWRRVHRSRKGSRLDSRRGWTSGRSNAHSICAPVRVASV